MTLTSSHRFIQALLRQPVDCTPIWIMRQAGRYLPEYRAIRQQYPDFVTLFKTPELACEITLQPLRRFDLDAAIIYSDILTIPDAMGLPVQFIKDYGPHFADPIRSLAQINALTVPDPTTDLNYVLQAIRLVKQSLHQRTPVIGFAGSPWTLATYMIEGGSSKNFSYCKTMLYDQPAMLHQLLSKLTTAIIQYLTAQIEAGADAVMLFDTWGGILTPQAYECFSFAYLKQIVAALPTHWQNQRIPKIIFAKNAGQHLSLLATTQCDAIGIDWTIDLSQARQLIGEQLALQGNLDPCILYASPSVIREQVSQVLTSFGTGNGHVFNLGHGIHPDIDPEKVGLLVDMVHSLSHQLKHQTATN